MPPHLSDVGVVGAVRDEVPRVSEAAERYDEGVHDARHRSPHRVPHLHAALSVQGQEEDEKGLGKIKVPFDSLLPLIKSIFSELKELFQHHSLSSL